MMTRQEIKRLIYEQQTKLAPSKISGAGVGVFAIVEIPKDTLIKGSKAFIDFVRKEDDYYLFDWNEFEDLDDRIKTYLWGMTDGHDNKFYIDAPPFMFYQGYYINHSDTPNCFWDRRTSNIYTQIDIKPGEELTMYYMLSERDFQ
jgi:SET domain-containing protein